MSKQDRSGVRTAQDLERKYNLAELAGVRKAIAQQEGKITRTNATLENFMKETLKDVESLQTQIDGNVTTFYLSGVPTMENMPAVEWDDCEVHLGDLYYDTDTGMVYRFARDGDGFCWEIVSEASVVEAMELASKAQDTADGKRRVFVVTPIPPYDVGDLYVQGNNGDIFVCIKDRASGVYDPSEWDKASKYTDDSSLDYFVEVTYNEAINSLNLQIDGKVTTWYESGEPTLDWETEAKKKAHCGDMYYDRDTGYAYRYDNVDGVYQWVQIQDRDTIEALAIANSAKDTADGKRRVFTETPYPPYENGDLWFKDGEIYICQISKPAEGIYEENDFITATNYTDDTYAIKVGEELKVLSGTVTTIKAGHSELKATVESNDKKLRAELSLKVDENALISKINASAAIIELKSNRLIVESDNLTITKDGTIKATNGEFTGSIKGSSGEFTEGFIVNLDDGDGNTFGMELKEDAETGGKYFSIGYTSGDAEGQANIALEPGYIGIDGFNVDIGASRVLTVQAGNSITLDAPDIMVTDSVYSGNTYDLLSCLGKITNKSFAKAYLADSHTCTYDYGRLTLEEDVRTGDAFEISDGVINVLRDCTVIIMASAYATREFNAGDTMFCQVGANENTVICTGSGRAHESIPYMTLPSHVIANLTEGDFLTLNVKNGTASRGIITGGTDKTYLCVAEI